MIDNIHDLKMPWWLRPLYVFIALNVTMACIAWWVDDATYAIWKTAKYFGAQEFGIVVIASISFALGNYLGWVSKLSFASQSSNLNLGFKIFLVAALAGYPIWFASAIANGLTPQMLLMFFAGEAGVSDDVKDISKSIPGITTIIQFGITAASIYPFLKSVSFFERWMFRLLIVLCLTRAIILSNRLAIIELAIPLLISYIVRWYTLSSPSKRRWASFFGPPLLVTGLFLLFAFSEYFRSWQFHKEDYTSFWQFIASRLFSYYVTALNNGAILTQHIGILPFPFFSLLFFWYFPWLPESLRYQQIFHRHPEEEFNEALKAYSTEELNNGCGIFLAYVDFGLAGFIVHWIAMAFFARVLFRAYCKSSLVGQLFFPLFLIAIIESPRIAYLSNTRTFPAILGGLAVLFISRLRLK